MFDFREKEIQKVAPHSIARSKDRVNLIKVDPVFFATKMVAYEFYWTDEQVVSHLIGILPERRKRPERITRESIMNWVRKISAGSTEINNIYFIEVNVPSI